VSSGGIEYVLDSGTASGTSVRSGGREFVSSGGAASSATVLSGGADYVYAGASAVGTIVRNGGKELVSSGGAASGTVVASGGIQDLRTSGTADATQVESGGAEVVSSGGTASGVTVSSGGDLEVASGGAVVISGAGTLAGSLTGAGAIVESGGGDLVLSGLGAAFRGQAVISGGTIELSTSGALGKGSVVFAGAARSSVLRIDAADAPAAGGVFADTLSNFSASIDEIDLRGVAYVSAASATLAGAELVLTDGGHSYRFDLAGAVGSAFTVTSDGFGGTLIEPRAGVFTQAAAALAPTNAASLPAGSSGTSDRTIALFDATRSVRGPHE
jgi:autotransporter passenger strand-loop-strand repeat protein